MLPAAPDCAALVTGRAALGLTEAVPVALLTGGPVE